MAVDVRGGSIYEELVELLARHAVPSRVLGFRPSPSAQARVEDLLEKSRDGCLSPEEVEELDELERLEHVVRLLKARLLREMGS